MEAEKGPIAMYGPQNFVDAVNMVSVHDYQPDQTEFSQFLAEVPDNTKIVILNPSLQQRAYMLSAIELFVSQRPTNAIFILVQLKEQDSVSWINYVRERQLPRVAVMNIDTDNLEDSLRTVINAIEKNP